MREPVPLRRVLVLVEGELGERLAGPEIRALGLARLLSAKCDVVLAARRPRDGLFEGYPVIPFRRRRLIAALRHVDAVVSPWVPPYLYAARGRAVRLAADLYDPLELELLSEPPTPERAAELAGARRLERMQLRHADAILCATDRQRERLAELAPRVPVTVVPFGIGAAPEPGGSTPLRDRFGFAPGDCVVFWWGALWRWLDPVRAIEAVALLAQRRPEVKLVLSAGVPPAEAARSKLALDEARSAAERLGVQGTAVHFLEEWIPFAERGRFLQDADLGITLDRAAPESELAIRARILDYVWAGLPSVLSGGDALSGQLAAAGAAELVGDAGASAVADAIERLLEPAAAAAARQAVTELRPRLGWDAGADELLDALSMKPADLAEQTRARADAARYYAAAAAERIKLRQRA